MTLRRDFLLADLDHLANLCHNCRGCYFSCQYAPPHPFGVNVPRVFAELRTESYARYAWPQWLAALYQRNGTVLSLATLAGIALVLLLTVSLAGSRTIFEARNGPGSFYAVISHEVLVSVAGVSLGFSLLALAAGAVRFWRGTGGGSVLRLHPLGVALRDVMTLRNLGGSGGGCNDVDEHYSSSRRRFHHAMFYGFLLCFAATSVATVYDRLLGRVAPYRFLDIPVQLGFWGGLGLLVGTIGTAWLKIVADPGPAAPRLRGAEFSLLALLLLISATGLMLLAMRATAAMGILLAVHLGAVLTFFLFAPYSKMVHGLYRALALLRNAIEQQREGTMGDLR